MRINNRIVLLELAQEAILAVRGNRLVREAAAQGPDWPVLDVLAIGKAASSMLEGAREGFGARLRRALLVSRADYISPSWHEDAWIETLAAGHPLPTEDSLAAGKRLLDWLQESTDPLLVLLSGGTSSLVEVPAPGVTLEMLQQVNRWLLGSGLDIRQVNAIRKRLSRIKGGQLLEYLGERPARVWMISDVRGDDPAVIGSGLLYPANMDTAHIVSLPGELQAILDKLPEASRPLVTVPEHRLLANLPTACSALVKAARERELPVQVHDTELDGDAAETGRQLAEALQHALPGLHLWGGETTVQLPAQPGRGGRNQQLALAAATVLAGKPDACLLALGTDGSDGPTEDAGALVDGGSIARGELAGLDAEACLRAADAGTFLEASCDLISTGPTGTNVRDIVLALKNGAGQ
jgi:hydroxypyruvate reductase